MNPNEVWIPLSMFIGLALVLSLWVWFRYKAKRDLQETIRTAIEKGQGLSPELVENLVNPPVSPQRDLLFDMTYAVVVFSLIIQGLTIGRLFTSSQLQHMAELSS